MTFKIISTDNNARAGILKTKNSEILTPVFMPVGTLGSVKALDSVDLIDILQTKIILANTYHLYLRPGIEVLNKFGGVGKFSKYPNTILTDSGGFQAFSLSKNAQFMDDGIVFKSHIDGSKHIFTPQKVIDIQYAINSDIMMVLDDLIALPSPKERIKTSIERTANWAKISLQYHRKNQAENKHLDQNIFAIVQGGVDKEFRKISANSLVELHFKNKGFDGFAIGGLSVGEEPAQMYETVEYTTQFLPKDKPRYLMGVGTPQDLVENVERGIDMFDCVMPTRNARNGTLFTSFGKLNIKKREFVQDHIPIDSECECYTCKNYSRAYLNHLFRSKELTYFRLASLHNLHYYLNLMKSIRASIIEGRFKEFKKEFYSKRVQ